MMARIRVKIKKEKTKKGLRISGKRNNLKIMGRTIKMKVNMTLSKVMIKHMMTWT